MGRVTAGLDEHFRSNVASWSPADPATSDERLARLFEAQALSRHLDFAARDLHARGEGFYTIGSAGHESNAAVALALRPDDPALLHYRSGGFYCARAAQVDGIDPVRDVLLGPDRRPARTRSPADGTRSSATPRCTSSRRPRPSPRTCRARSGWRSRSTARRGSASPRPGPRTPSWSPAWATPRSTTRPPWAPSTRPATPSTRSCRCRCSSSARTTAGASRCRARRAGSRTRCPRGPGFEYVAVDGADASPRSTAATEAADWVRSTRKPVILHLRTVRFLGHAGSDAELGYRRREGAAGRPRPRPAARHGPGAARRRAGHAERCSRGTKPPATGSPRRCVTRSPPTGWARPRR